MATMDFRYEALERWPYGGKGNKRATFKANANSTYSSLRDELRRIGARNPVLQTGHRAEDIRFDGLPRVNARVPRFPGVCLVFERTVNRESRFFEFPCATYNAWEDNIRAIALSLQALRAIGRYGVIGTNVEDAGAGTAEAGKQYEGFARRKVEARTGAPTNGAMSKEAAAAVLAACAAGGWTTASLMTASAEEVKRCYRQAAQNEHPDAGGSHDSFVKIQTAYRVLTGAQP